MTISSLAYYDQLLLALQGEIDGRKSNENNLQIVPRGIIVKNTTTTSSYGGVDEEEIAICNLAVMLPFKIGGELWGDVLKLVAPLALAAHHLNVGDGSVVDDVEGMSGRCPVRFTLEYLDTGIAENQAVDEVIRVTDRHKNGGRPVCAFLGAMASRVSMPTSIITGLRGYPQISALSTSPALGDPELYPLFGRTVPSDDAIATPIVLHLKRIGVRYLGVVYINDSYGTAYVRGLESAARNLYPELTIKTVEVTSSPTELAREDTIESIQRAVKFLKETKYHYFFSIVFPDEKHELLFLEAYDQGIAGTGTHTWLLSDSSALDPTVASFVDADEPLYKALLGSGAVVPSGGLPERMPILKNYFNEISKMVNPQDVQYLISKSPYHNTTSAAKDENYPIQQVMDSLLDDALFGPFLYDSLVAVGLGACNAQAASDAIAVGSAAPANSTPTYFDGRAHFESIMKLTHKGPSGLVEMDPVSGNRNPSSTYAVLLNYVPDDDHAKNINNNGTVKLKPAMPGLFENGIWNELEPYVYADSTNAPPPDLPILQVNEHFLGTSWRIPGYVMAGIGISLAVAFAVWTRINRDCHVVRASQPFFLYLICFGIATFVASIIPFGVDEEVAVTESCTIACQTFLWLSSIGFCITFSALATKTHRVNVLFHSPGFRRVKVTPGDVAKPMVAILGANILILTLMTILSPLQWTVEIIALDVFDREIETRGYCDWSGSLPYVAALAIINLCCLIFALVEAYAARDVSIEFAETEYIFKSMLVICLACFFGFPILLIVHGINNAAFYFFLSATIFITGCAVLLLIFVPKIMFLRANGSKRKTDVSIYVPSGQMESGNFGGSTDSGDDGLLVLRHPKSDEIMKEKVRLLEKELRDLKRSKPN